MSRTQIIIVGGGLAGLTAAIHLSRHQLKVLLIEKNEFPHHKVCGEYLSAEVKLYLEKLGLDIFSLGPKEISRLEFSTTEGKKIDAQLDLGGIGISRYTLDNYFFQKARELGCEILHESVENIEYKNETFSVSLNNGLILKADFVLGAFGKRSLLDRKLDRRFQQKASNWLAVKAHYKNKSFPDDLVALHNFNGGYCGLSKIENGEVNACYLATFESFKKYRDTADFQKNVLMKNRYLKEFFSNSEMSFQKELTIAQINFHSKEQIKDHVIMLGDAAGLIHPLCGNGMAMAIHSAKIASEVLLEFFKRKDIKRASVEKNYEERWKEQFNGRMFAGRLLQKILMNHSATYFSQQIIDLFPGIMPAIVKQTHGNPIA
ncbi:FAD-dependent oxidoreductase [Christiangramia fulva]|uniref:FAD-dependent oxidoreductase n=1 Tax=Christiangramia fulva TaxID=2126553 RepID=A0A2R3Z822_9FLAO|nr:NAD(P)/FAD-dependent oxidoreductase [Christiangramia fulva]AVR46372.1 FAD-dependent oxidoreductase [Christiangramia fulva]